MVAVVSTRTFECVEHQCRILLPLQFYLAKSRRVAVVIHRRDNSYFMCRISVSIVALFSHSDAAKMERGVKLWNPEHRSV